MTATSTTECPLLDTLSSIRTRRSIKQYRPDPLPKAWIEELLDAAHWAPNHHLTHPWRFHVFSGEGRARLVSARQAAVKWRAKQRGQEASEQDLQFARQKCFSAPTIVIVSMTVHENPITEKEDYAACWCAIQNLLLAATARGLGSYPSTGDWVDQNFLGPVLGLGERERPVACVFLGYADQEVAPKRLPVERHTHWYVGA